MNAPQALLVLAAVAGTFGWAASGLDALGYTRWAKASRRLLVAAASLALAGFLFLLSRFVAADVSYQYVFLYTEVSLPLHWRIAGTWAGREGSLLLWAMWLAGTTAAVKWSHRLPPHDEAEAKGRAFALVFLSGFSAAFLWAVVAQDTFARTPDFFLAGRPDGNGLNPTLKSQFILIHPPLMFLAYALATVPAAAVLGHLVTGSDRWSRVAGNWSRVNWLVYTVAMGLGGIWAYYTLGFGGYWAWDPVEVANLLPWLALTVYLHAQLHHDRYGDYLVAGPFLGLLPFLLTVFSTISTRSGLWVSVHAFTDPTNTFDPDAAGRFQGILEVEPTLAFPLALMLATFSGALALLVIRLAKDNGSLRRFSVCAAALFAAFAAFSAVDPRAALGLVFEAALMIGQGRVGLGLLAVGFAAVLLAVAPTFAANTVSKPVSRRITLRGLGYFSVLAMSMGLLVLFLLHMAATNGWDTRFYEARLPFLAAPVLLGLIVLLGHRLLGGKRILLVAGATLLVGLLAASLSDEPQGAFLVTGSLVAFLLGLEKVRQASMPRDAGVRRIVGSVMLWVGAMADVLFWLNPPTRVGFGAASFHPVWPAQLFFGALALYALWGAHRILAGAPPRRRWHVYALVGMLEGFFVAAPLAGAAWLLHGRREASRPLDGSSRARLRQAALYGLHLAVAMAFLGYSVSTYWKEAEVVSLTGDETATVGPQELQLLDVASRPESGTVFARQFLATFNDDGRQMQAPLTWEPQAGAYFPVPATIRLWNGDLYAYVRSVDVADSGCGPARTITAFQASAPPRACHGSDTDAAQVELIWLPGLGLMWLALALFSFHMAMLILFSRPAARPALNAGPNASIDRVEETGTGPTDQA